MELTVEHLLDLAKEKKFEEIYELLNDAKFPNPRQEKIIKIAVSFKEKIMKMKELDEELMAFSRNRLKERKENDYNRR